MKSNNKHEPFITAAKIEALRKQGLCTVSSATDKIERQMALDIIDEYEATIGFRDVFFDQVRMNRNAWRMGV